MVDRRFFGHFFGRWWEVVRIHVSPVHTVINVHGNKVGRTEPNIGKPGNFKNLQILGPVHWAKNYGSDSTDWYPAVKGLNWNTIF